MAQATVLLKTRKTTSQPHLLSALKPARRDEMRNTSYGFKQLPYDLHENDYASWSWTDLPAQRTAGMKLTQPFIADQEDNSWLQAVDYWH
jgi:hypothetical protein